jgi:hypothetical protein
MAKEKCKKCGHKLALAKASLDMEFYFDQEPYVADEVEPVYIDQTACDSVDICGTIYGHVCPACATINDLWVEHD